MDSTRRNIIIVIILLIVATIAIYLIIKPKETVAPTNSSAAVSDNLNNAMNGLKIEILKEGTGIESKKGDTLTVHYTGTLQNGTKFDSSLDRNQPFAFNVGTGQVIQGWDEGLLNMKVGEKRKLTIPAELAYGSRDLGVIPPNSTLIFEVELLKIN